MEIVSCLLGLLDSKDEGATILRNAWNYFSLVLLTVYLNIFISVIKQLDAQNVCFTKSSFHVSTCFENMCSASGGQNCITQPLVTLHL